jgi:hypothetical protein
MDLQAISSITPTVFYWVGVAAGLWVAKGLLAKLVAGANRTTSSEIFSRRPVRVLLWMALGSLFAAPVAEILAGLQSLFLLLFWPGILSPPGVGQTGEFAFAWMALTLMVVIYGAVLWTGMKFMQPPGDGFPSEMQFTRLEKTFILLALASLIYQLARGIFLGIILLPGYNPAYWNPFNLAGFVLAALAGAGVLIVLVLILSLNTRS